MDIKKLFFVFGLTGIGQVLMLLFTILSVNHLDPDDLEVIGLADSVYIFITTIISLGITQYYARDIANEKTWFEAYSKSISFRLVISLIISLYGLYKFMITKDDVNIVFLAAPIIAVNGDFALYARGMTVLASFCSFVRTSMPYLVICLILYFFKEIDVKTYILLLIVFLIISSSLANKFLSFNIFKIPFSIELSKIKNIITLGIGTSVYNSFRNLVFIIASLYWSGANIATVFAFIKIYLIYHGVKRVIVQAYFKEVLTDSEKTNKLNRIILISTLVSSFVVFLIGEYVFSLLFEGSKINVVVLKNSFSFILICNSFFSIYLTRLLASRRDSLYFKITTFPSAACLLMIFFSSKLQFPYYYIFILLGLADFTIGFLSYNFTK